MTLGPRPTKKLAVVTCMDSRIDVDAVLGLTLGDAHVIRNAGGRVTDDVLRSLAISVGLLGVESVIVMEHTLCGLAGTTDDDLRARTGANLPFHAIADHDSALREDVETLANASHLTAIRTIDGVLYDLDAGKVVDVCHWERASG